MSTETIFWLILMCKFICTILILCYTNSHFLKERFGLNLEPANVSSLISIKHHLVLNRISSYFLGFLACR